MEAINTVAASIVLVHVLDMAHVIPSSAVMDLALENLPLPVLPRARISDLDGLDSAERGLLTFTPDMSSSEVRNRGLQGQVQQHWPMVEESLLSKTRQSTTNSSEQRHQPQGRQVSYLLFIGP